MEVMGTSYLLVAHGSFNPLIGGCRDDKGIRGLVSGLNLHLELQAYLILM